MKFGRTPVERTCGAILAHSLTLPDGVMRKGAVIGEREMERFRAAGLTEIVVASPDPEDLDENIAAARIGAVLTSQGLHVKAAFTGRVNLVAETDGLVRIDTARIAAMNDIDEVLTLATLPDASRVSPDQLVATVKIIPYALPTTVVAQAEAALGEGAITLHPFRGGRARLLMTETPGFNRKLLQKGERIVRDRVETLGYALSDVTIVEHTEAALAEALNADADLVLILGASATSDRADVAPAAVVRAGGRIERFGMPVDPGNLLFLGSLGSASVVGLPGCARSPALNGVDWVLERISARIPVTSGDIAAMGVGGLLKEMPGRPEPRRRK